MKEAEGSNFAGALEVVNDGLNAHPASEGLLFLRSYFCYKIADSISSELSALPRPIQPLGEGVLMVDGAMTNQMLGRFQEKNMRMTFTNTPNIAGNFCVGCRKNISFDTQTVVFRKTSSTQLEVWHLPCFKQLGNKN